MSSLSSPSNRQAHRFEESHVSPGCSAAYFQSLSSHAHRLDVLGDFDSLYDHNAGSEMPEPLSLDLTYGESTPTSPPYHSTSISESSEHDEVSDDDNEDIDDARASQPKGADNENPKTAAEQRAEKRKMKRFRLNHNQTRFLLNDFARQPHPDAAQRERLSREVPGLSPRQVQVWFQNRRAKLKRLTNDDRERMMESRAVPEDFDMTQALRSPYGVQTFPSVSYSSPVASATPLGATPTQVGSPQPLMIGRPRPQMADENLLSPASTISHMGPLYSPPDSLPPSGPLSPVSPPGNRTSFPVQSDKITNPFVRSSNLPTSFRTLPKKPQLHNGTSRTGVGSLTSPLRSSFSYSDVPVDTASSTPALQPYLHTNEASDSYFHGTTISPTGQRFMAQPQDLQLALEAQLSTVPMASSSSAQQSQHPSLYNVQRYIDAQFSLAPNSAPLSIPHDFHLPLPSVPLTDAPIPATPGQDDYTTGFPAADPYHEGAMRTQAALMQDLTLNDYPQSFPQSLPPPQSIRTTNQESAHPNGLYTGFAGPTRKRSFTHPAHQQRSY